MLRITRRDASSLLAALPSSARALLEVAARLAAGSRLALVGGTVRDLALGLPLDYDLDLVVEGDAPAVARALAQALGGSLEAEHAAFGTATLRAKVGEREALIDITTARRETYARPATLPDVTPAALDDDLARRDFSLNAMALELLSSSALDLDARLLDPFGGMADLEAGQLRVLHDASFRDDPTRILRGLRLAARIGLDWEPHTRTLLRAALNDDMLERTGPERVQAELCLALAEPRPDRVLQLGDEWGIAQHIFPPMRWNPTQGERWQRALAEPPDLARPSLALGLLSYELDAAEREMLRARYRLPGDAARLLREVGVIKGLRAALGDPALPNSRLDALLAPFSAEAITVVEIAEREHEALAGALGRYLNVLRPLAPLLNGRDLLALGVRPGPQVGTLLARLRAAQADGLVTTREQALALARQYVA
jgi:tRNA nucleotidyltransferase (CCA-adding enzyme)